MKIKHVFLPFAKPVFPARIPTFHQYPVEPVFSREVNVFAGIGGGGAVASVSSTALGTLSGLGSAVIPGGFAQVHFPPDANVLGGFDPTHIGNFTGFIQVEDQFGGQQTGCIRANQHHSPGGLETKRNNGFAPQRCTRHQKSGKGPGSRVDLELHGREIDQRRFVNGQMYPRGRAQGKRGLASPVIGNELGGDGGFFQIRPPVNCRNRGGRVSVLVAVPVARLPPGRMVAGHGKFTLFFHHAELAGLPGFAQ